MRFDLAEAAPDAGHLAVDERLALALLVLLQEKLLGGKRAALQVFLQIGVLLFGWLFPPTHSQFIFYRGGQVFVELLVE